MSDVTELWYYITICFIAVSYTHLDVYKRQANTHQDKATAKAEMGQHYPLGRIGKPHEIGEVIVFLLSNKASFVTGAAWTIDGGLTSW